MLYKDRAESYRDWRTSYERALQNYRNKHKLKQEKPTIPKRWQCWLCLEWFDIELNSKLSEQMDEHDRTVHGNYISYF